MTAIMLLLLALPAQAVEVWTEAGVSARLSDPVSVDVSGNWRATAPPFATDKVFGKVNSTVRLHSNWRLGLGYRSGVKEDGGEMVLAHRVQVDGTARWRLDEFRFRSRLRYQVRLPATGKPTRHTLRERLRATADFDLPVRPGLMVEAFVALGDGDGGGDGVGLDKVRMGPLLRIPIEDIDVDFAYFYEHPIRAGRSTHILSVAVVGNLDLRRDD